MIYWGLTKRNDRSVQEIEHYLQYCYCNPEPQVNERSRVMSGSWTNHSRWISSPNRTEASESVLGSSSTDLQVTQSKLTFRRLTVTATGNEPKYRRIWSCDERTDSAPVPPTLTELRNQFDSDRRPMKTSLFTSCALDCKTSTFHITIGCFNNIIAYMLRHCVIT